jgi:hypothetical protein
MGMPLSVYTSVDKHFNYFYFLAVINNAAGDICLQVLCGSYMCAFLLGIYLGVELLGHMVTLCLGFGGIARLFQSGYIISFQPESEGTTSSSNTCYCLLVSAFVFKYCRILVVSENISLWFWFVFYPPPSFFIFWDRVLLCSPNWPWTCDPPASAYRMPGLQMCATMPGFSLYFLYNNDFKHLPLVYRPFVDFLVRSVYSNPPSIFKLGCLFFFEL